MKFSLTKITFLIMLCASCLQAIAQLGTVAKVPVNTKGGNQKGYIEYLPPNYDGSGAKKYPVLYWLHGNGGNETGDGSSVSLDKLYNRTIAQWLKTQGVGFIVLVPQDHSGYFATIRDFVDWANGYYSNSIDVNQQHMAGLSAGGYGIREFIKLNTATYKAFATFTPMSTNWDGVVGNVSQFADNNQYVWIHHGTADTSPNDLPTVTRFHHAMYAGTATRLRSRITAYEGLGHSAWEKVYNGSGRSTTQRTGAVLAGSSATFYTWTTTDPDGDWFGWMLTHGKVPIPAPTPPVVKVGVLIPSTAASFKVMGNVTDDGTITAYAWQKVSGPSATLVNATSPVLTVSDFSVGTYVFKLTATDNTNSQSSQEATVYVEAEAAVASTQAKEALPAEKENKEAISLFKGDLPADIRVVIFSTDQAKVFDGTWKAEKFQDVFNAEGLYIYHLTKDEKRTTGKVYIKR